MRFAIMVGSVLGAFAAGGCGEGGACEAPECCQVSADCSGGDACIDSACRAVPEVVINSPSPGAWIGDAAQTAVAVSGSCSEAAGTVRIRAGVGLDETTCAGGSFDAVVDASAAADGDVTITAEHLTHGGAYTADAAVSVRKDTVAPIVNLAAPAGPIHLQAIDFSNRRFNLRGSCSESGLPLEVQGGSATAGLTCVGGTFDIQFTLATGGMTHSVAVFQTDSAGNRSGSAAVNVCLNDDNCANCGGGAVYDCDAQLIEKLTWMGPGSMVRNACTSYSIRTDDECDFPVFAVADRRIFLGRSGPLSGAAPALRFYNGSNCTTEVSSVTVTMGQDAAMVWVSSPQAGAFTLWASSTDVPGMGRPVTVTN